MDANMNIGNKATNYAIFDLKLSSLKKTIKFIVVSEEQGNLFEKDKSYALATCIAADLNMGSGLLRTFRQDFKGLGELMAQHPHTGGLVYLHFKEERYIYYLVTKREAVKKPTYETLYKSLEKLREHMVENNVKLLAIPRLGCGLDRLEWDAVKVMIEYIFTGTDIKITVCNYQQNNGKTKQNLQTKADTNVSQSKMRHESNREGTIDAARCLKDDESDAFANNIMRILRRMDEEQKLYAEITICQVLLLGIKGKLQGDTATKLLHDADEDMPKRKIDLQYRKCPTKYLPESIKNIKGYNIVLYIGSLDGGIDNNLKNLFSRFSNAERTYKNALRRMGEIVTTPIENYTYYLVGCIAKTKIEYDIDCVQFEKCISTVKKENEEFRKTCAHYASVAIQTYSSKTDDLYMAKLQNLMKTYLYDVTIYIYEY